jgi:hypothetical protein
MARRFTPTAFLLCSGLLIWIGNFLFVYTFAALACAWRFAHVKVFGFDIVRLASSASSILAALAIVAVMWTMARRLRDEPSSDAHSRFVRLVTLGAGGLALLALVWIALPPLLANEGC